MRHHAPLLVLALALLAPDVAHAQRTLAQDTMSMDTPVAVSCGFCAAEAYGVVFQRIGTSAGLVPADFPLTVESVSLALGAAEVTSGACHGIAAPVDPDTLVHFELWAGTTPPPSDIGSLPVAGMPWPGEDMLVTLDDVPVTMSVPTTDGGANFNLMLNTLMLGDSTTPAPMADATHSYLRAVVVLNDGGNSSTCTPSTNAPTGFPLRDDDGVVQNERSFIYAEGLGWRWNEQVGVRGDWGIRLTILSGPRPDAGAMDAGAADAGAGVDASTMDAGAGADTGASPPGSSGNCGCRTGTGGTSASGVVLLLALAVYASRVSRRRALRASPAAPEHQRDDRRCGEQARDTDVA